MMRHFSDDYFFVLPTVYIDKPNLFTVIEVFHTIDDFDTNTNLIESDIEKNYKLYLSENDLKENEKFEFYGDFTDEEDYPYNYFFVEFDNIELTFRDKQVFIAELINLFDFSEEQKYTIFDNLFKENNCNQQINMSRNRQIRM